MIGKQYNGGSHFSIKEMALKAINQLPVQHFDHFADIGSGSGTLAQLLQHKVHQGFLLDADPPQQLPANLKGLVCDLNEQWPLSENTVQLAVALEVVEHIENPRHFFRELERILTPGGYAFVSTPHNANFIARLLFLFSGEFRYFQDYSYPAHITVLVKKDIERITSECGLKLFSVHYNHLDVLPLLKLPLKLPFSWLSNSVGFLLKKEA